ncbi:MAG: trypsin-like peptidase domain-containing protein [Cylindrospermopsis raciborskii KL1]|jgi:serine protease Do|uniref:S1C family serine protease n=1 Tax=Cylindrospermopsis raciborskii TaxID=77022 RepID=UPI0008DDC731|nr:trypsin-like peptidase domain-containing protein [Cylindrospermopsis raciborskii]MBG0744870.1 trypsin-like peptidase domain-containing protein [Cylindrospermopsis raciborskii KL1]NLQ04953.1 trypsin-like serine protease [Cylindrospermopsis raciborskii MVCC19]OHY34126.1 hypothetical protein BCV64_06930 [Cylindrospermopsis raciborskii MVCC14]
MNHPAKILTFIFLWFQPILTIIHHKQTLAVTSEEKTNLICTQASKAVLTIKTDYSKHGSGFLVNNKGLIITNAHVVSDGPTVATVVFSDGQELSADLIGFANNGVDLAALKIHNRNNLPYLKIARNKKVKVGFSVFAIGSPINPNYQNTCTQGIISNIHPNGTIQHTATTNPGNSGGPLLNNKSEVIGVNTWGILGGTAINLSQSIDKVHTFLADIQKQTTSPVSTLPTPPKSVFKTILPDGKPIKGKIYGDPDVYTFAGVVGQKILIQMNSDEINSHLTLSLYKKTESDENEQIIAQNDDKVAGDFNAEIITTLPENGIYQVLVKTSRTGETGIYNLRVITQP